MSNLAVLAPPPAPAINGHRPITDFELRKLQVGADVFLRMPGDRFYVLATVTDTSCTRNLVVTITLKDPYTQGKIQLGRGAKYGAHIEELFLAT